MRLPPRAHEAFLVRQRDLSTWEADAMVEVPLNWTFRVTDHPIEDGATVSDHVQELPSTITLACVITENPSEPTQGGPVRLRNQLQWLLDTASAGDLVNVVTRRLGTLRNYAITRIPTQLDKTARLEFRIDLRRITIAQSVEVFIDVENIAAELEAGAPDNQDVGEQATTSTDTDPEAEDSDQSYLAGLLDTLG